MKKKTFWIEITCTILLFIIALLLGVFTFKNGFNIQESNASNLFSFLGGMLGTFISIVGSFIILFITIKKNNEQQIKLINEQNAAQMENSLQQKFNKERESFNNAYNALEQFIMNSKTYMVDNTNFISVLDRLNSLFIEYRKSMNSVLILTNVYTIQDKCVGCTLCDLKNYGELARVLKDIQSIIIEIENNTSNINIRQNKIFDKAIANQQIVDKRLPLTKLIENYKNEQQLYAKNTRKFKELEYQIVSTNQQICNIDTEFQKNLDIIKNENSFIVLEVTKLDNLKLSFLNKIKEYFGIANLYMSEHIQYIKNNERTFSLICKKLNLENPETKTKKSKLNKK